VLDALPTFAMGALELPPALLHAIKAFRRAFLWNTADRLSGAKCLVAWDAVCRPKHEGGLGIKSLAAKNECLQLKLATASTPAPMPPGRAGLGRKPRRMPCPATVGGTSPRSFPCTAPSWWLWSVTGATPPSGSTAGWVASPLAYGGRSCTRTL
jgi:hypothetical protein